MFLVCHVVSENQVILWLFDIIGKRFLAIDIVVVKM